MEHQVNNYYFNQDNFNNLKVASYKDFIIIMDEFDQASFMANNYYLDSNFSFMVPCFIQEVNLTNQNLDNSDILHLNCYWDSFLLI